MSPRQRRLLAREPAGQVDGGDRLVDGVGLDVLVEERRRLRQAEPAQAGRVAAVRDRGGHLEQREVADDRAAQAPVQAAERHQVHGRERDRGEPVDVGAVGRVEPDRRHRVGEQLRVDPLRPPAAVLVRLDLDERRLRPAAQPRQRPRVRIGLLELVGGAVDQELEHLVAVGLALDVARERRAVVLDRAQGDVHRARLGHRPDVADLRAQRGLERRLERGAQREQRRLPLPALVDARQPAVVQLVAAVQRELEVLVGDRVRPVGERHGVEHGAAARAARRAAPRSCRRGGREARA